MKHPRVSVEDDKLLWQEDGVTQSLFWRSPSGAGVPRRCVFADDRMSAEVAYPLVCEGTALLWRGDYHNARQLLQALARRIERRSKTARHNPPSQVLTAQEQFHRYRLAQAQRARTLGLLLLPLTEHQQISLRRAPDVQQACLEVFGATMDADADARLQAGYVMSLRELQGIVGAHEWRKKGVEIPQLGDGARIHPHYGVFSPVRGEYLDLVARAPLPRALQQDSLAYDIGTGTGVLAALLARRGVARVLATDQDERALHCARDNMERLALTEQVHVLKADLFPPERAALIVCNPPWLPGRPATPLEHAIYDPDSRMLHGFLQGLAQHLLPAGEGWLILSDLAEHLGLRTRAALLAAIEAAGLCVVDRLDIRPRHPKVMDVSDPLHAARAAEVTSLWRLAAA